MDSDIKVYKMNEYEWLASKWSIEKTNEWYENHFDDNPIEDVKECNLDTEGMWYLTTDKKDIERLGGSDELFSYEIINGNHKRKTQFGDLIRRDGEIYKFISYRDAIQYDLDFKEPYCIASTEW